MHRRAPRLSPPNYVGCVRCFFTICTHDRAPTYHDPAHVKSALLHLRQAAREHDVAITAYCFMPDHVHLLVEGRSHRADLLRCLATWKRRTAYAFWRGTGRRLWQAGFYDRVLRASDDALDVAAYILANPIRAGLSARLGEFPVAGSDVHAVDQFSDAVLARRSGPWR